MNEPQFPGSAPLKSNFTRVPNAILENLNLISTMGELKVIMYIVRHTIGWHNAETASGYDDEKKITTDEFMNGRKTRNQGRLDGGCGISKPTVLSGLKRAVEHGFIRVDVDERDLGRVKKFYSLRMVENDGSNSFTPPIKKSTPTNKKSLHPTEKETDKRNQEKILFPASADTHPSPPDTQPASLDQPDTFQPAHYEQSPSCPCSDVTDECQQDGHCHRAFLHELSLSKQSSPPISAGDATAGEIINDVTLQVPVSRVGTGDQLVVDSPTSPRTADEVLADVPDVVVVDVSPDDLPLKRPKDWRCIQKRTEEHFFTLTQIPVPARRTKQQKQAAQVRWWGPIQEIGDMCEWDEARMEDELSSAFKKAQTERWDQNVTAPKSLLETVRGIIGARKRAVAMAEPVPFGPPGDYVAPVRDNGANRKGSGAVPLTEAQKAVSLK